MGDLRKVGALWRKTSQKNGRTFYSGRLNAEAIKSALAGGETSLLLFPVKEKRGRGPDIELFCAPDNGNGRTTNSPQQPRRDSQIDDIDDFGDLP